MKKRILALLLVTAMGVGLLSGCGCARKVDTKATINLDNLKKADKKLVKLLESDDYKKATPEEKLEMAKDTVDQLVEEKVVEEKTVTVIEELGVVTYQYTGGGAGTIETKPIEEPVSEKIETPSKTEVESKVETITQESISEGATVVEEEEKVPVTEDTKAEWSKEEEPLPEVVADPRKESVSLRIYNAFEDNEYRNRNYQILLSDFEKNGFDMSSIEYDDEVYVEELLEIPTYSMVSFSMHGTVAWAPGNEVQPVVVLHDDLASEERNKELENYLSKYEVGSYYGDNGGSYYVYPKFFSDNLTDNALENTIIYSETCCFLGRCENELCDRTTGKYCNTGSTLFPDVFCKLGTPAVAGFHNSVMAYYAVVGLEYFVNAMYLGYTPEMAYSVFVNDFGYTDWNIRARSSYSDQPSAFLLLYGNNITVTAEDLVEKPSSEQESEIEKGTESPSEPAEETGILDSDTEELAALKMSLQKSFNAEVKDISFTQDLVDKAGLSNMAEVSCTAFYDEYRMAAIAYETDNEKNSAMQTISKTLSGLELQDKYEINNPYYVKDDTGYEYTIFITMGCYDRNGVEIENKFYIILIFDYK